MWHPIQVPFQMIAGPVRAAALFLILGLGSIGAAPPSESRGPVERQIEILVERVASKSGLAIAGDGISSRAALPEFYRKRGFGAAWTEQRDVAELVQAIRDAALDGLRSADYHLAAIEKLQGALSRGAGSPEARAELDVLLSDALARLGFHLYYGKVDPERIDSDWNVTRSISGETAAAWMKSAIETHGVRSALENARPHRRYYQRLAKALADYRSIARRGGWPAIPEGPILREGMRDPRVPIVRRRLSITGDYGVPGPADSLLFESKLTDAVRKFQYRAYLDTDGAVGPGTARAMSVPVTKREGQVRVDLERARWVMHELPPRYLLVNISSFMLYLMEGDTLSWSARCQVGKVARKTPIFRANMTYLVFNPDWTVPSGIVARDILPAARRGEPVLQRKKLKVIDRNGRVVNPATVRWPASVKDFPYTLRQDPGPDNALGRVKFMFPNRHSVYIHDTPSKDLFEHSRRAFSSGCVRVEHPLDLAERVLADPQRWSRQAIQQIVDAGKMKTVTLAKPVPVLLLYWTVNIDPQGLVRFSDDVYSRDAPVLQALDEAPVAVRSTP